MAMKTVNLVDDLPKLRAYIAKRVRAQAKAGGEVVGIVVGMKLCQSGHLVLHFNTGEDHERSEEWMDDLDGTTLKVPRWSAACMAAEEHGVEFVLPNGTKRKVVAGKGDRAAAAVFGNAMLAVLRDAKARGAFEPLSLRKDCQVEVREFDWLFEWPADEDDMGEKNLFRRLRADRLPG